MDSDASAAVDEAGLQLDVIAMWGVFILILVGGVVILLAILRTEEEEDEYAKWGEDGYEDSLTATYGAVAAAPSVPRRCPRLHPHLHPSQPPPLLQPLLRTTPHLCQQADCLQDGPWNNGSTTVSSGLSKTSSESCFSPTLNKRRVQGAGNLANHAGGHHHVRKRTSTHLHLERRYTTNSRSNGPIQQHRSGQGRSRCCPFHPWPQRHGQNAG